MVDTSALEATIEEMKAMNTSLRNENFELSSEVRHVTTRLDQAESEVQHYKAELKESFLRHLKLKIGPPFLSFYNYRPRKSILSSGK